MTAPHATTARDVDVWVDLVCPWCRINHARLDTARQALSAQGVAVDVRYRPFQLAPRQPPGVSRADHFARAFGDLARAEAAFEHVRQVGAAEGIAFRFDLITHEPNTLDAHRLLQYAQQRGAADAVAAALYEAFFMHGRALDDLATLIDVGTAAGLQEAPLADHLRSGADARTVQGAAFHARDIGVRGVPTYGRNGVPAAGAPQPGDLPALLVALVAPPA